MKLKLYLFVSLLLSLTLATYAQDKKVILPQNWYNLDLTADGYFGISTEKAYNELLINKYLTYSDKTNLLKIKLDYIINGQCYGKKRFIIQTLIAVLLGLVMTGMGPVSISLFLNALLMLFREGKISRALYLQLMKAILAGKIPVPLDELEQFVE